MDLKIFIFCSIFVIASGARKCSYIDNKNALDYIKCMDISSMNDISSEIEPSWSRLVIINKPGRSYAVAETETKNLDIITSLDLSMAGSLVMSDHGFKDYRSLVKLNISQTGLSLMKISWFLPNSLLENLDISKNRLRTLSKGDVENLKKLKFANFSSNDLENIQVSTFAHMNDLEELDLDSNSLKNIDIGDVPNLISLSLDNNLISVVPSNGFTGMPKLRKLSITNNGFRKIEDKAFYGLTRLKFLNLSSNSIEEIRQNIFEGLSRARITILDLSNNDIRDIAPNGFAELPFLQTLDLSRNSVAELSENMFSGLRSIKILNLIENDIVSIGDNTFANLPALEFLDLSSNNLQLLNEKMFGDMAPKLRKLFVKKNSLVRLNSALFTATPNIDYLSLGYNEIKYLDDNIFASLKKLSKLHLAKNVFEEFSPRFMNSLETVTELLIDHNKLSFLPEANHTFPRLVKVAIEANPWQCPCLDDILNFLDSKNIEYRKSYYFDGRRPVCVPTSSRVCVRDIEFVRKEKLVEIYQGYEFPIDDED